MKNVFITGGSSGIGADTVKMFAEHGYNVAFTYNTNKDGAANVVSTASRQGVKVIAFQADLSREALTKKAVEFAVQELGRIDILVNNAGGYFDGDEWDGSENVWSRTIFQNLISVMNVSKYVLPLFEDQQSGVIVNVASRLGMSGSYEELAYGAAKAGVINITQGYADFLAPYGRANSVSPGAVQAGYWNAAPQDELDVVLKSKRLQKLATSKDVANAIFYLATDLSSSTTGQNLVVNDS